eukprot:981071_1
MAATCALCLTSQCLPCKPCQQTVTDSTTIHPIDGGLAGDIEEDDLVDDVSCVFTEEDGEAGDECDVHDTDVGTDIDMVIDEVDVDHAYSGEEDGLVIAAKPGFFDSCVGSMKRTCFAACTSLCVCCYVGCVVCKQKCGDCLSRSPATVVELGEEDSDLELDIAGDGVTGEDGDGMVVPAGVIEPEKSFMTRCCDTSRQSCLLGMGVLCAPFVATYVAAQMCGQACCPSTPTVAGDGTLVDAGDGTVVVPGDGTVVQAGDGTVVHAGGVTVDTDDDEVSGGFLTRCMGSSKQCVRSSVGCCCYACIAAYEYTRECTRRPDAPAFGEDGFDTDMVDVTGGVTDEEEEEDLSDMDEEHELGVAGEDGIVVLRESSTMQDLKRCGMLCACLACLPCVGTYLVTERCLQMADTEPTTAVPDSRTPAVEPQAGEKVDRPGILSRCCASLTAACTRCATVEE